MLSSILSIYIFALFQPIFHPFDRRRIGWLISFLPAILLLYFFSFTPLRSPIIETYPWVSSIDLMLSFRLDGLALLFALLVVGIGALVMIYAGVYLKHHKELNRFYAFILIFMGSMLGLVLANNLILLFIFWELTTISSYLLIGFHHEKKGARNSAQKALIVTMTGGLSLLVGILLLGTITGSYEISTILEQKELIQSNSKYLPILILIAIGAFAKSAQFPLYFWLPGAMAAPTPVSAYLHSATMVNAGIYLLLRLYPVLGDTIPWAILLTTIGTITMLLGAILSLFQRDLKLILAYSTISVLGMMVNLIGANSNLALQAAIILVMAHALYKASLFMIAGAIDHLYHTRNITKLCGLAPNSILLSLAAGLAAMSNAGLPPLLGFLAKEQFFTAQMTHVYIPQILVIISMISGMFLFASAMLVGFYPFWRKVCEVSELKEKAKFSLYIGPIVLSGLSLWAGLFPANWIKAIYEPAMTEVIESAPSIELHLWHGFNWVVVVSLLSYIGGIILYLWRVKMLENPDPEHTPPHKKREFFLNPEHLYHQIEKTLTRFANWQTDTLQNGYLRVYMMVIILTTTFLIGLYLFPLQSTAKFDFSLGHSLEFSIYSFMFIATLVAVLVKRFLVAVVAMGVVGFGVVLLFALYSAPDLALTQLLVETLSLVLFVLMLKKLPHYTPHSSTIIKIRDAVLSITFGGFITLLLWHSADTPITTSIANFYSANAQQLARGSNIVNVILVDFRGLDTLGEITVLAIAGIGVFGLLKLKPALKLKRSVGSAEAELINLKEHKEKEK